MGTITTDPAAAGAAERADATDGASGGAVVTT
jgi:hypothetical protein